MKFIINGGRPINGTITLAGAKNAATKMMVASLLTSEPCSFKNFPIIGDTEITAELCRAIGSTVSVSSEEHTLFIHTPEIKNCCVVSLSRKNRIPILTLGPLLVRVGQAEVPVVGGDKIGPRPVNFHVAALEAMGAKIEVLPDRFVASAKNGLHGATIKFPWPSVGATETAILGGVLAKGRTTIYNAAVEPEVIDLINMLQKMGAIIELGANRVIKIDGVSRLRGVSHFILSDRNEAVSFACLAVAVNGRILVRGARQSDLITYLNALRKVGGDYEVTDDGIIFYRARPLTGIELETDTHPGFMTDWQQPFAVLMTQAQGQSSIHETVYEDRFGYAQDLNLLGANIKVFSRCLGELPCRFRDSGALHSALIQGPTSLVGNKLKVKDLRAGIAHVIAALIAQGQSEIDGIEEIDRGYERIDERLRGLGADIQREA